MTLLRFSLALLLILATPALAGPPPPGARFDIQLQAPMAFGAPLEAIELDPDEVNAAEVADLNRRGVYTICYVSVGTAEEWRADFDQFPPEVLGREYDDWPGEFFLDARRTDLLLPLMVARFQRCRAMGFDAIEADNIDLPGQASGFPLSRRDVVAYVSKLAQSAHAMGLGLGQKNFPEAITALSPLLDFAVVESCFAQGWCNAEAPYIARGKPVFAIEYAVPAAKQPGLCAEAARQKISLVFKTLDLTAEGTGCP